MMSGRNPSKAARNALALAQNRDPGEAGLEAVEDELLEQGAVVPFGRAPLVVVIGDVQRVLARPGAALQSVGVADGVDRSEAASRFRASGLPAGLLANPAQRRQASILAPDRGGRSAPAASVVVGDPVDRGSDRNEFQRRLRRRGSSAAAVGASTPSPSSQRENVSRGRIAGMRSWTCDISRLACGGDDAGGVDLAAVRVRPGLVEAGEAPSVGCRRGGSGTAASAVALDAPPFVKAVGDHEAAAPFQRGAEARLLRERLRAGVDQQREIFGIFDETRQETPARPAGNGARRRAYVRAQRRSGSAASERY